MSDSEEDNRKPRAKPQRVVVRPPDEDDDDDEDDADDETSSPVQPYASAAAASAAANVKPALKKTARKKDKKKHLKWDEEVIEEHDQLRGTRMKIDEPNTPYTHYDSGAESDDSRRPKSPANQKATLSWDVLQTRLDSVAAVRDAMGVVGDVSATGVAGSTSPASSHGGAETDGSYQSDVEEERRKEMRRLEFKEHRKRHYNEMEAVRRFRQEHPDALIPAEAVENADADVDDDNDDD